MNWRLKFEINIYSFWNSIINFVYKLYLIFNGKIRLIIVGFWDISMEVKFIEIQMYWVGYVWKMNNSRVAKQFIYQMKWSDCKYSR